MAILAHMAHVDAPKAVHLNRSAHEIIDEEPRRLNDRLKSYVQVDSCLYAQARTRFQITKEQFELKADPQFLPGTGDLTFYERLQSFFQDSPQERRARLTRRFTILKHYTRDLFGAIP
jgi:hypothetical protein